MSNMYIFELNQENFNLSMSLKNINMIKQCGRYDKSDIFTNDDLKFDLDFS